MNAPNSNSDGKGGAILTLIRVLVPGKTDASELELEEAHYSDWAPKKAKAPRARHPGASVIMGTPAVSFLQDGIDSPHRSAPIHLPLALLSAAFFAYAVPTTLEFFAFHHASPWVSTILPGDLVGCVWLAIAYRMRLLGVLLYAFLTAAESGLYTSGLIDAGSLVWLSDIVPALFVAVAMTRLSHRVEA